jgi:ABC-type nitrate/sulfonate/bicarbonate transport system permease component
MAGTARGKSWRGSPFVLAIFALWEFLSRSGIVNPRLLPSASDTLSTLGELLQRTAYAPISW